MFPVVEYWWFYAAFLAFIFVVLAIDLGIFNRKAHEITFKEATVWSAVWVVLALSFNLVLYLYTDHKFQDPALAKEVALQFLAGYVLEYALSVDNIFVFVLVFSYFGIPAKHKHRVLFYGILGALLFRAIFIAAGSALMQIHWIVYVFGGFLVVTGIKMLFAADEEIAPEKNLLIRLFKRFMPVTHEMEGQDFIIRRDGRRFATPLLVTLLFLEATDIVFAVDSVPAIFAVTKEPMVVFTSNIFAILGLRSMFFMLAGVMDKFHLLKYGLSVVLVFVGLKMVYLNDWYVRAYDADKFPITYSLGIIVGVLGLSILASLMFPQDRETAS